MSALPSGSSSRPALAALAFISLVWGYNWVVMKRVMDFIDPLLFSALRNLLGALALFTLLLWRRQSLRPPAFAPTVLLGFLQTALFTILVQWALEHGGAGKTAVLVYVMPFWLIPLAWLFLAERVHGLQWLAVAVAAAGLLCVLEPWHTASGWGTNLLALGGSLSWALSALLAKRLRQRQAVNLLSLTAWQMLFGALMLCLLCTLLPSRPVITSTYFFVALGYNALFATALAWWLWLFVLDHLSAGMAGLSALAVPAIGVLAAWLQLGERPSAAELAGMLCIMLALLLVSWISLRPRRSHAHG